MMTYIRGRRKNVGECCHKICRGQKDIIDSVFLLYGKKCNCYDPFRFCHKINIGLHAKPSQNENHCSPQNSV